MIEKPFWQQFAYKILEVCGVDYTKCPVSSVSIDVFGGKGSLPTITVTFQPFEDHELRPFVEIFQAAEWKNTRK